MIAPESVLLGESAAIRRLRRTIERVAPARLPVLIEGATGTGKELVARLLHEGSGRRGALVAFNVCALGETMFEDALFGHVRGAFTGATNDAPGFLREAHGGTAFFDEIGGLPLMMQAKLLRAIETGVFRPVGASRDSVSDFRLVTATNEGLDALVGSGQFRADLAHRLSGIVLTLPPLDERREDIAVIAAHFAGRVEIDGEAMEMLLGRAWPGNVRELKQVIDSALVFAHGSVDGSAMRSALAYRSRRAPAIVTRFDGGALDAERSSLVALLEDAAWDTERVATALGIHRSTLYRRLKKLGLMAIKPSFARIRPNSLEFGGDQVIRMTGSRRGVHA